MLRVTYGGLMALNLLKRGTTFTVTDAQVIKGGDPDTTYTLKVLTRDDSEQLTAVAADNATHKKFNEESGRVEDFLDRKKWGLNVALGILDFIIVDWTGWECDGQPMPCTLEWKRQLPMERQDRLLELAKDNARIRAAAQQESFREAADLCGVRGE